MPLLEPLAIRDTVPDRVDVAHDACLDFVVCDGDAVGDIVVVAVGVGWAVGLNMLFERIKQVLPSKILSLFFFVFFCFQSFQSLFF